MNPLGEIKVYTKSKPALSNRPSSVPINSKLPIVPLKTVTHKKKIVDFRYTTPEFITMLITNQN